jgi:hypothetical protein
MNLKKLAQHPWMENFVGRGGGAVFFLYDLVHSVTIFLEFISRMEPLNVISHYKHHFLKTR